MIDQRDLRDLARKWSDLTAVAVDRAAEARANVRSWTYINGTRADGLLEPHVAERAGLQPVRRFESPDKVRARHVARVGCGADGCYLLTEPVGHVGRTEVVFYENDRSESYVFYPADPTTWDAREPSLVSLSRQRWSGGRLVERQGFAAPDFEAAQVTSWVHEKYEYNADGQLTVVECQNFIEAISPVPTHTKQVLYWLPSGALERIDEIGPAGRTVKYRSPSSRRARAPERYRGALRRHIVAWARENWPAEQVSALMIVWSDGGTLPPNAVLVTDKALTRGLLEAPDDPLSAWNPADHELWDDGAVRDMLASDELDDERATINELDDAPDALWDLLRGLCQDLAEETWAELPGSDAAVICLVDATNLDTAEFFAADTQLLSDMRAQQRIP